MLSIGENAWILKIRIESLVLVVFKAPPMSPIVRLAPEALLTRIHRVTHLLPPKTVAGGSPTAALSVIFIRSDCGLETFLDFFGFTIFYN
jgi:hypothetical protein